jgi:hypothetical protein
VSPAIVRRCHFPDSPVAARVLPGRAALCLLRPSRAFSEVLIVVIVIGWTAPGPEIFRVYAHLAFSHAVSTLLSDCLILGKHRKVHLNSAKSNDAQ